MLMLTVDTLPEGYEVTEIFGAVWARVNVRVSVKGLFAAKSSDENDLYPQLETIARQYRTADGKQANAILGIKVAMTTAVFNDGTFCIYHISGTAVRIKES